MAKPPNVIEKRMANALFKSAAASGAANKLLGKSGQAGLQMAASLMGGMWVGGTAYLTPDAVEFHPNGLNKLAHAGSESLTGHVPLSDITKVTKRFGIGTKIIDIETAEGVFSLRCYNSQSFLDAIEAARA